MSMFLGFPLPNFNCAAAPNNADYLNDIMVMDMFSRITNIALSRFKWINLPRTCNERALEMTLFFYGKALFFYDPNFGLMHTPFTDNSEYNIYYESTIRNAFSFNYNHTYNIDDSVIIRNNITQTPDYFTVWNFVPKIADAIRAIDVHTNSLKRPFIMYCSEKERTTYQRILKSISDNEIAIIGKKMPDDKGIGVLEVAKESYLADFWANVKNYLNQIYSSLGIRNSYSEKKERMIVSEVEGEGNAIRHTLQSALNARKEACIAINTMFKDQLDAEVSVEANEIEVFQDEIIERLNSSNEITINKKENDEEPNIPTNTQAKSYIYSGLF